MRGHHPFEPATIVRRPIVRSRPCRRVVVARQHPADRQGIATGYRCSIRAARRREMTCSQRHRAGRGIQIGITARGQDRAAGHAPVGADREPGDGAALRRPSYRGGGIAVGVEPCTGIAPHRPGDRQGSGRQQVRHDLLLRQIVPGAIRRIVRRPVTHSALSYSAHSMSKRRGYRHARLSRASRAAILPSSRACMRQNTFLVLPTVTYFPPGSDLHP